MLNNVFVAFRRPLAPHDTCLRLDRSFNGDTLKENFDDDPFVDFARYCE